MDRRSRSVLLAVFGTGVFLAGLELMITAVALPSILDDLADPSRGSAWVELRKASWIINGYLLVYILTMPLAGRFTDLWGARRPFLAALAIFTIGSALAGLAQTMDQLIAARLVQAVGGGVLVPVGTAAAAHLYPGAARPRALGIIAALTFLGMAAGPFLGAAILASFHPADALAGAGLGSPWTSFFAPAWRWIFFINVPIGLLALLFGWAASSGWDTPRRPGRADLLGAAWFGLALVSGLVGLTLIGTTEIAGGLADPAVVTAVLLVAGIAFTLLAIRHGLRREDPFLDPRLFTIRPFAAASLVSLLTGYAFATAIIGGAVFVDRVLYGGPDDQRLALGALAGATAVGALVSGFALRIMSPAGGDAPGPRAQHRRTGRDGRVDVGDGHRDRGALARDVRARVRPHRHPSFDRGRGGRGPPVVRGGGVGGDRRADDRHGDRPGHPDGVRLHDHRPARDAGLRHPGCVPPVHPRDAPGPAAP